MSLKRTTSRPPERIPTAHPIASSCRRIVTAGIIFLPVMMTLLSCPAALAGGFQWSDLAPLPDEFGFGGPIVGVHNGTLIVAGGANYTDTNFYLYAVIGITTAVVVGYAVSILTFGTSKDLDGLTRQSIAPIRKQTP